MSNIVIMGIGSIMPPYTPDTDTVPPRRSARVARPGGVVALYAELDEKSVQLRAASEALPCPSLALDFGQWAMRVRVSAIRSRSAASTLMQWILGAPQH